MNLRSGASIWVQQADEPAFAPVPLLQNARCRFAVVGSGVTGALLIDALRAEVRDIVLVDSRSVGGGSTAASTSLLLCEPDTHFVDLMQRIGDEAARRVHVLGQHAIERLGQIASEFPGHCDFARRPSLYLASSSFDTNTLDRECVARERLGLPCERLTSKDLQQTGLSVVAGGALRSPIAAEINAYQLTQSLIRRAVAEGLRAYSQTRIVGHDCSRDRSVILRTDGGHTIRADAVVFASGYEAHEQLGRPLGTLASTWVLASEPITSFHGWPDRALIWETARPYLYLRTTPDNRCVVGGGDEPFSGAHADDARMDTKIDALSARFRALFPNIPLTVACGWAGVFGSSRDGLPYIGRPDPQLPVYFALGYGGNGITYSLLAAEIIADQLRGRSHRDLRLFRFDR